MLWKSIDCVLYDGENWSLMSSPISFQCFHLFQCFPAFYRKYQRILERIEKMGKLVLDGLNEKWKKSTCSKLTLSKGDITRDWVNYVPYMLTCSIAAMPDMSCVLVPLCFTCLVSAQEIFKTSKNRLQVIWSRQDTLRHPQDILELSSNCLV